MKRLAQKALFQIEKWDSRVLTPHRHDVTKKLVWHWFGRLGNFTAHFRAKSKIMDKMSHR